MYTIIISILCLTSILLLNIKWKEFRSKKFLFWLIISCMVGWIEFICFLRYDAWIFDHKHIIGIFILGVSVEDLLFCPCFSVVFFWLYNYTKRWNQRIYNPSDKLLFTFIVFGIALAYYDIGSQFSKYMALRTAIGFVGLIYCWNYSSFRHSIFFLIIVYIIGFGWDLPSVHFKIWTYINSIDNIPKIYAGLYLKILNAIFPIELFGYYFTGGFFSFWTLAFCDKYFEKEYIIE